MRIEETVDTEVALTRLRETAFDVVISVSRRSLMTGVEFLDSVRTMQPMAVGMVLSASSDSDALMRAVNDVEVLRYLLKPLDEKDLTATCALRSSVQTDCATRAILPM
ncbi:MAG: response regulator [Acidovorax sp.]|uniref:response regulator n=1 Tax=Acidovorax sp. TaxID=1872122 RepID=UPI00391950F1